jgi:hypothetical protein
VRCRLCYHTDRTPAGPIRSRVWVQGRDGHVKAIFILGWLELPAREAKSGGSSGRIQALSSGLTTCLMRLVIKTAVNPLGFLHQSYPCLVALCRRQGSRLSFGHAIGFHTSNPSTDSAYGDESRTNKQLQYLLGYLETARNKPIHNSSPSNRRPRHSPPVGQRVSVWRFCELRKLANCAFWFDQSHLCLSNSQISF